MGIIILTLLSMQMLGCAVVIYYLYQMLRLYKADDIIDKWIEEDDPRYDLYDYDEILDPCRKNWYGLKWPNSSQFK